MDYRDFKMLVAGLALGVIITMIVTAREPAPPYVTPPIEVESVLGRMPNGQVIITGKCGGVYGIFHADYELTYQVETMFDMEHTTKVIEIVTQDSIKQLQWQKDHTTTAGWDRFTTGPWARKKR